MKIDREKANHFLKQLDGKYQEMSKGMSGENIISIYASNMNIDDYSPSIKIECDKIIIYAANIRIPFRVEGVSIILDNYSCISLYRS